MKGRPKIPWDKALPGATHALWSPSNSYWYFWRVLRDDTTMHDCDGTGRWHTHRSQIQSQRKLENYLRQGYAFSRDDAETHDNDNEEGYTPMNLNNAALLVRDDITTVHVHFPDNNPENTRTYILHDSVDVNAGDDVLVERGSRLEVGTIVTKDAEPQINVNSNTQYKWVIGSVTDMRASIAPEIEATATIAKALKQKQAASVRDQILQQFGVANHGELLALGQNNPQS